ncbi:putative RNA-binding protein RbpE [Tritrichomonas foetus]|uniref:RNA-binding protein RbpE n=1 Tax=Tritrichomonas foetus TaxID=1144522 RepID=A0A1J4JP69_9EUKA|nr:putative RNA-binding protein RbpE [Tritrichomonas foetus]|eukprot:OHS99307.1 putative RNA-binding protein RbpE [Tritrichomonas foetus]
MSSDEGSSPQDGCTIHVGQLKWEVTEDDLLDYFKEFGKVKSTRVPTDPKGRSRGFGFVEFATKDAAEAAVEKTNGIEWKGRNLSVSISHPRSKDDGDRNGGRRGERRDRDDRRGGGYRDRGDRGDRRDRRDDRRGGYRERNY